MGKKNKIFVVWEGKEPGIYRTWEECKRQIHGYGGALYKGFDTEAEAREAMTSPCWDYIGKNAKAKQPSTADIEKAGLPNMESLSVDAACSGNPGLMEYRGVYTRTKEEIFRQGPFKSGTNNIGEFLALVHGLAFLKQKNSCVPTWGIRHTAICSRSCLRQRGRMLQRMERKAGMSGSAAGWRVKIRKWYFRLSRRIWERSRMSTGIPC